MTTLTLPIATEVRRRVEAAETRAFLTSAEMPGPRPAVEMSLSRLVSQGELVRVRHGLYWKAPKTRVGMPRPRPVEVALKVAGSGSGPAGVTAARALGLTTQVPRVEEIAVPGRVPKAVEGVIFRSRPFSRRLAGLSPLEVAVLELLRSWPTYSESPWGELVAAVTRGIHKGSIRPERVGAALRDERAPQARLLWERLTAEVKA